MEESYIGTFHSGKLQSFVGAVRGVMLWVECGGDEGTFCPTFGSEDGVAEPDHVTEHELGLDADRQRRRRLAVRRVELALFAG